MKRHKWMALFAIALLIFMTASVTLASGLPTIDWWVISGGGAPVSGGNVTMNGSVGQPVIGHSEGENIALEAGYWVVKPEYTVYLPVVLR